MGASPSTFQEQKQVNIKGIDIPSRSIMDVGSPLISAEANLSDFKKYGESVKKESVPVQVFWNGPGKAVYITLSNF